MLVVVGTALATSAQTSGSSLRFSTPIIVPLSISFPDGIAPGDVNNDGIPDLTISASHNGDVLSALGTGDGTFGSWMSSRATFAPYVVVQGKFDGQNLDTIVNDVANPDALVLLGAGNGFFPTSTSLNLNGNYAHGFAVGDFNGDSKSDIAAIVTTPDGSSSGIYIYLGNGDGTFQTGGRFSTGGKFPTSILVGDFNGDNVLDLAVLNAGNGSTPLPSVAVLLGNGNGTFKAPLLFKLPMKSIRNGSIAAGRFTASNMLDVAVTGYYLGGGAVAILLGNGDGTFRLGQILRGGTPTSIAVGDFNGDGQLDLVDANDTQQFVGYVTFFLGNGDGTFQEPTRFAVNGQAPLQVVVADFNLDLKPDVATVNTDSHNVSVLLNATQWPTK